jgi:hypothetical protein
MALYQKVSRSPPCGVLLCSKHQNWNMREDMGGFGCGSVSKMYAGPPNELTVLRVFYKTLKEIGYAASLLLVLHQKSN